MIGGHDRAVACRDAQTLERRDERDRFRAGNRRFRPPHLACNDDLPGGKTRVERAAKARDYDRARVDAASESRCPLRPSLSHATANDLGAWEGRPHRPRFQPKWRQNDQVHDCPRRLGPISLGDALHRLHPDLGH